MPLEPDLRLGQRAGLVGAQHVHAAEVLDRRQPPHDDLLLRQSSRTHRQRHRDHHRQQLGRETHCQCDREQEGGRPRPAEQQVGQQHQQRQQQRQPHDQRAEAAHAQVEGRGRRLARQCAGQRTDRGARAGALDHGTRAARQHRRAHEHRVGGGVDAGLGRRLRVLFRRERFASQHRLLHEAVARHEYARIGRDQIAGCQQQHIARHDLGGGNRRFVAIAQHARARRDRRAQALGDVAGAHFLHEVDADRQQHHRHDDQAAREVAGDARDQACHQQHQHQRIAQLEDEAQP